MTVAWWGLRVAEVLAGAAADSVGRAFLPPGRLGLVSPLATGGAWVHAASLGEAAAVPALARALERRAPDVPLHFTATTASGMSRLAAALGRARAGMAPLDAPWLVGRFLDRLRPQILLLVETELWPHWLMGLRSRGIPVAVVSARLSERSLGGYRRLGRPFRRLMAELGAVLAQGEEDASRWAALGVPAERVQVTGNLKVDALRVMAPERGAARRSLGLDPARPLWVLGSIRPGEARLLAGAWVSLPRPLTTDWQVALVPRHPAAARGLAAEAREAGLEVASRERFAAEKRAGAWRMDARLGVLSDYYAAAELAFVGGSLAPYGGHNPLEPAALGVPLLMGSHYESQRASAEALRRCGALIIVEDASGLVEAMRRLMEGSKEREHRGRAGQEAVRSMQGVGERTAERLVGLSFWPPR